MSDFHADFEFFKRDDVIVVIDLNLGSVSITNDVKFVLQKIRLKFGNTQHTIIYRDSDGIYDQIQVDKFCNFRGFNSLGLEKDQEKAIKKVKIKS